MHLSARGAKSPTQAAADEPSTHARPARKSGGPKSIGERSAKGGAGIDRNGRVIVENCIAEAVLHPTGKCIVQRGGAKSPTQAAADEPSTHARPARKNGGPKSVGERSAKGGAGDRSEWMSDRRELCC